MSAAFIASQNRDAGPHFSFGVSSRGLIDSGDPAQVKLQGFDSGARSHHCAIRRQPWNFSHKHIPNVAASMSLKPTIVICPGGWPSKTCFDPLLDAFSAKKYDAVWDISDYKEHNPNVQPPENLDTAHLRVKVLEPLINQGKDVALSMHSYGGFYGPAAIQGLSKKERSAKGLPGGIVALIWTASFVVKKGATLMGTMGLDPNNMPDWIEHDVSCDSIAADQADTCIQGRHKSHRHQQERRQRRALSRPARRRGEQVDGVTSNTTFVLLCSANLVRSIRRSIFPGHVRVHLRDGGQNDSIRFAKELCCYCGDQKGRHFGRLVAFSTY